MDSEVKGKGIRLSKVFLWSAGLCAIVSFFGPFAWKINSVEGIVYYFVVEGIFFVGLLCGGFFVLRKPNSKAQKNSPHFNSRGFSSVLLAVSIISVLCCAYLLISFWRYYGGSYQFGEASYEFADEGRGLLERVCTVFMQFGMASYLLGLSNNCNQRGVRKGVSVIGFWTTAIYYTVSGSRFTIVVSLIVFLVANKQKTLFALRKAKQIIKRGSRKALAIILALGIVAAVGVITSSRMDVDSRIPQNHYEFVPGDSPLKEEWEPLVAYSGPLGNALFSLFDYVGESPFVFAEYYQNYIPDKIYWCENTLRSIGQFIRPFGIDAIQSQSEIYKEIGGGSGKYSGFVYVLIVDFGKYLTPVVAFFIGFVFAKIERYRERTPLMAAFYPCVVASVLFAPIYYFYVGRLDYVVMGLLVLELFRRLAIGNQATSISKGQ